MPLLLLALVLLLATCTACKALALNRHDLNGAWARSPQRSEADAFISASVVNRLVLKLGDHLKPAAPETRLNCAVYRHMGHVTWQKIALKPTACKRHSCTGSIRHAICMPVLAHSHCSSCNYMTCMLLQREVHKGQQPVKEKLTRDRKQVRCRAASMHMHLLPTVKYKVLPTFLQELRALIVTLARSYIGMASHAGEHWRPVACVCSLLLVVNALQAFHMPGAPTRPQIVPVKVASRQAGSWAASPCFWTAVGLSGKCFGAFWG